VQGALTEGAAGRRRMDPRAPLVAVLVLVAGAILGAILYQFEQARATWRPKVTRTPTGWTVRDASGRGPSALALAGDHIVWDSQGNVITMDLGSGKTKLLGVGENEQSMWPPSVSDRYAVWVTATSDGDAQVLSVYAYDFASRRRVRLTGLEGAWGWGAPAMSATTMVWAPYVGGSSAVAEIRGEDLSTGRQFVVASTRTTAHGAVGVGAPVIAGDLVAWSQGRPHPHSYLAIVVRDLSTQQTWTITPFKAASNMHLASQALSGRTLVWSQYATKHVNGVDVGARNTIVAQNLDSGARRVIASGRGLGMPAIDGDLVVWTKQVGSRPTTLVVGLRLSGDRPFVIATNDQGLVDPVLVSGDTVAMLLTDNDNTSWIETVRVPQ
jgi:hypothetical protein